MTSKISVQGLFSKLLNFAGTKINFFLTGALLKMRNNYRAKTLFKPSLYYET
jgi:hypothetical protein